MTASAARMIEDAMLRHIDEVAKRVLPEAQAANGQACDNGTCELSTLLTSARTKVTELKDTLVERVHSADQQVHDNAWKTVGTAAAVAFVAGLLVAKR